MKAANAQQNLAMPIKNLRTCDGLNYTQITARAELARDIRPVAGEV